MILNSIKLKNFLSCKDVEVNFPLGFIGISGNNGSGKSSIFRDAIYYSIYNETIRTKSPDDIIYNKDNSTSMSCELNFVLNKNSYKIFRSYNKKKQREVKFSINNVEENSLKTDIQKYLIEIIGMDSNLFSQISMISPSSKCLLELSNADRKKFFYKLLDLERFDKIHDIANKKFNEIDKKEAVLDSEYVKLQKKIMLDDIEYEKLIIEKQNIDSILSKEKDILEYNKTESLRDFLYKDMKKYYDSTINFKEKLKLIYSDEEIKNLKAMDSSIENIEKLIFEAKSSINSSKITKSKFQNLLKNSIDAKCPTCEQELNLDVIQNAINNIEKNIADANKNLEHLQAKKDKILLCSNYLREKDLYFKAKEKFSQFNNTELNSKQLNINELLESKQKKALLIKFENDSIKNKERLKELEIEIEDIQKQKKMLANILSFSIKTPDIIIEQVFNAIVSKTNELLNLLPNKQFLNPNNLSECNKIYATSSTGEAFKLNIILRIAMNIILSEILKKDKIEFLVLDEGGIGNLDQNISVEIMNILSSLIGANVLKQIFFISHKSDLFEFCEHKYILENKNNSTCISKI